jgi:hypothetical protein
MSSLRSTRAVLLRVTPWAGNEVHGGQLRSQQLAGLIGRAFPDMALVTAENPRRQPGPALAALGLRAGLETLGGIAPLEAFFTAWVEKLVARLGLAPGDILFFDADQRYGPAVARVAARHRLRVVALPHNVEALIPYHWPIRIDIPATTRALARELGWLAGVEQVWAIGRLDCDIFQLFGIKARHLPYTPPVARHAELAAIRSARQTTPPAHILVLGTAHNAPTRAGMIEQLALLRRLGAPLPLPVIVAGYGSDLLAADAQGIAGVSIAGPQDWPQLVELMTGAAALWVHQAPMSGALTRIPEALIAGVPVIANGWAARGHPALAGLSTYDDDAGFAAAIAALPTGFAAPDAGAAEADFIKAIAALAR